MDTADIAMSSIPPITPLKRAIFESRMTQKAIADAIGLSEGQFSRIVNGLHTGDDTKGKIAAILGRTVEELWPSVEAERAA
jgi:transcriptional regulator with XRE-family HTH domain